jgi:hypothetical protein
MLERHADVAWHCVEKYPNLIVWHCSNHHLEIAVNDVVREMSTVCHMKTFFDKFPFTVHLQKNKDELESVALQLVKY